MTLPGVAAAVADLPATATLAAVRAIHNLARIEAVRYAGADRRLSNAGSARTRGAGGARMATRDDYTHGAARASATVYAVPPGIWRWATDGTDAHVIGFGRQNRRTGHYTAAARSGPTRLAIGEHVRMGPVFHPGTGGRGAWTTVRTRGLRITREIFASELRRAVNGG